MLYRITVKNSKLTSGIRVEKGMSVDVPSNSMSNPVTTNGGQAVVDAFMRIYGIDIRKAGALSMAWLDVERIDDPGTPTPLGPRKGKEEGAFKIAMIDYPSFYADPNGFMETHRGESDFLDSFCSARDKYLEAVNPSFQINNVNNGMEQKKELLQKALEEARNCIELHDDYSHLINPKGLIDGIEQALGSLH